MLQVMKLGFSLNPPAVTLFPCCLVQCSVCARSLSSIWRSWPSLFLYFSPVLGGVFFVCFHTNLVRTPKSPIYYTLPIFVHLTVIFFRILSYSLLSFHLTYSPWEILILPMVSITSYFPLSISCPDIIPSIWTKYLWNISLNIPHC